MYHIDVSNPDSVVLTGTNIPGIAWSLCAKDTLLFVGDTRFSIYSISVPNAPVLLSSTFIGSGGVYTIALRGDTAFVGTWNGQIVTVDCTSRTNPVIMGTYAPPLLGPEIYAVYMAASDTVLHASYLYGLISLSLANPSSMNVLSFFPTGYDNQKVVVRNGLAYVTSAYGGLWVADVSNPARPRGIGNISTMGYAYDLIVDSSVAYISVNDPQYFAGEEGWNGVWAVDISRPDSLRLLDAFATNDAFAISKSGSLLFVTHGNNVLPPQGVIDTTLTILDVSNPSQLRAVGYVVAGLAVREITSRDSIAFVATSLGFGAPNPGLKIYDCRNPANPQLLSTVLWSAQGVSLYGNYACVHRGGGWDSTFVVDITNLTMPVIVGRVKHPGPSYDGPWESLAKSGRVFWANRGEVGIIDVANPNAPRILFEGRYGGGGGIDLVSDTLYLTGPEAVLIYRHPFGSTTVREDQIFRPNVTRLLSNYPNPFNSSTQIRFALVRPPSSVSVQIFDILGQLIREINVVSPKEEEYTVRWDGTTNAGIEAASGVYLYRLNAGGSVAVRKMLLIR